MAKNNNWIWIVVIVGALFFFMNQQKVDEKKEIKLFCDSEEPTTLDGYKAEIQKWDKYNSTANADFISSYIKSNTIFEFDNGNIIELTEYKIDVYKCDLKGYFTANSIDVQKIEDDSGIEMGYHKLNLMYTFCSNDKTFLINIDSRNEDDAFDLKETYISKMYDCTIDFLPSVSNKWGMYGGIAILVLLFLIILKFRK